MVGIFSKFSTSKIGHRRTQSALDESEVLPQNLEVPEANLATSGPAHGIEVAVEFKPIEHPTEPLDNDEPIECPRPEPSILNVRLKFDMSLFGIKDASFDQICNICSENWRFQLF